MDFALIMSAFNVVLLVALIIVVILYKNKKTGTDPPSVLQNRHGSGFTEVDDIFNVKDHGAMGDDKTDDTAALQLAINLAMKSGGGIVYLPPGTYRFTGLTIARPRSVTITGPTIPCFDTCGSVGARLRYVGPANTDQISIKNCYGLTLSNLFIYRDTNDPPLTNGSCIRIYGEGPDAGASSSNVIDRVVIENAYNGIVFDGITSSTIRNCGVFFGAPHNKGQYGIRFVAGGRIDLMRVYDTGVVAGDSDTISGFLFDQNTHTIWVDRCIALRCNVGYHLRGGTEFVRMSRCDAENTLVAALMIEAAQYPWISQCYLSSNRGCGVLITDQYITQAILDSLDLRANDKDGIQIQKSSNEGITIINPRVSGNNIGINVVDNCSGAVTIMGGSITMNNTGVYLGRNTDTIIIQGVNMLRNGRGAGIDDRGRNLVNANPNAQHNSIGNGQGY